MCESVRPDFLFQLIDRKKFDDLCIKWNMDKGVRCFTTWDQTCSLIMATVMRLDSLREIEAVLGVPRSTFCDANSSRSSGFFQELCEIVLLQIKSETRDRKLRRAIRSLLAIDSSECRVHGSLYSLPGWRDKNGKSENKKAIVKFHAIWNVDDEWIEDFRITPGRRHDSPIAKQFPILSNHTYVFDRAYRDMEFWKKITQAGSHFVSRLHNTHRTRYKRMIILPKKENLDGVLWDGEWKPNEHYLKTHSEEKNVRYRHVMYRDPETKKLFDFITSDFESAAQDIADIYRKRWAVELLFRWLKGHLNIRHFPTKNPNTIRTQLAITVLVQLLVQLYKISNSFSGTLWECLRSIRTMLTRKGLQLLPPTAGHRGIRPWTQLPSR